MGTDEKTRLMGPVRLQYFAPGDDFPAFGDFTGLAIHSEVTGRFVRIHFRVGCNRSKDVFAFATDFLHSRSSAIESAWGFEVNDQSACEENSIATRKLGDRWPGFNEGFAATRGGMA